MYEHTVKQRYTCNEQLNRDPGRGPTPQMPLPRPLPPQPEDIWIQMDIQPILSNAIQNSNVYK